MKKLLALLLTIVAANAAEQEFQKGVTFTSASGFTPAGLNQLVDNAVPASNRGLVLVSSTTPDTATYPRFTNYLWIDISALPYTLKSYQTGSWVSATIGANTITTSMIQDAAVTNVKIATDGVVTTNIVANAITDVKIQDGAITTLKYAAGSITNAALAANAVNTTNIYDNAITTAKLTDSNVTGAKIASGSISNVHLASSFLIYGTNIAGGTITSTNIGQLSATNLASGASAFYSLQIGSDGSSLVWTNKGLLQVARASTNDVLTCATQLPNDNTVPQNTEGDQVLSVTITPKSATSTLRIRFTGIVGANNNFNVNAALFQDSTANALSATSAYVGGTSSSASINIQYSMTSGTTSATTFKIRVGPATTGGGQTAYLNGNNGTRLFGGVDNSSIIVEEIQ